MNDLLKLLDGSVDDVKTGLAGKSRHQLAELRAAEQSGKTRKGVLDAIDAILGDVSDVVSAADEAEAETASDQNRIDFNDPNISGREAVEMNLAATATD